MSESPSVAVAPMKSQRGRVGNWISKIPPSVWFGSTRVIVLLVLIFAVTAYFPSYLEPSNFVNVLRQAALLAFISYGMAITMIAAGMDISVGSVVALSSVAAAPFLVADHPRLLEGVAVALAAGLGVGVLNGLAISMLKIPPFIATYAMMQIARALALLVSGGYAVYGLAPSFRWIGTGFLAGVPATLLVALALFALLHLLMHHTVFGRWVYALGANPKTAFHTGIPVRRTLLAVYALSGLLAGIAGLVYAARVNAAEPEIGDMFALDAISVAVLGGVPFTGGQGTLLGMLVGALIIAVLTSGLDIWGVSALWQVFAKGLIILLAVGLDLFLRRLQSGKWRLSR
ncbi:MAG: ABC transporter permease [Chloroflexi bacterium]|nr:ABC transporter permease [Chloroflexota bacterium]